MGYDDRYDNPEHERQQDLAQRQVAQLRGLSCARFTVAELDLLEPGMFGTFGPTARENLQRLWEREFREESSQ